jgi:predicted metal-dependent HD superfamily phosphohydrolase
MENVKQDFTIENIHDSFREFSCNCRPAVWRRLNEAYNESHRVYHTWSHIDYMLRRLDKLATIRKELIVNAIFWHDVIYQTKTTDGKIVDDASNVVNSAALFMEYQDFKSTTDSNAVLMMILGTSNHLGIRPVIEYYEGFFDDYDLFIDLDLSELGRGWAAFNKNNEKIRKEFEWVPLREFQIGRRNIFKKFYNAPHLFRTDDARKYLELQAKDNLSKAITQLNEQIG